MLADDKKVECLSFVIGVPGPHTPTKVVVKKVRHKNLDV
jgi:hypothetical protein